MVYGVLFIVDNQAVKGVVTHNHYDYAVFFILTNIRLFSFFLFSFRCVQTSIDLHARYHIACEKFL